MTWRGARTFFRNWSKTKKWLSFTSRSYNEGDRIEKIDCLIGTIASNSSSKSVVLVENKSTQQSGTPYRLRGPCRTFPELTDYPSPEMSTLPEMSSRTKSSEDFYFQIRKMQSTTVGSKNTQRFRRRKAILERTSRLNFLKACWTGSRRPARSWRCFENFTKSFIHLWIGILLKMILSLCNHPVPLDKRECSLKDMATTQTKSKESKSSLRKY